MFRWARGQKLGQNLLSLQLPLYEKIMERAPERLRTLCLLYTSVWHGQPHDALLDEAQGSGFFGVVALAGSGAGSGICLLYTSGAAIAMCAI